MSADAALSQGSAEPPRATADRQRQRWAGEHDQLDQRCRRLGILRLTSFFVALLAGLVLIKTAPVWTPLTLAPLLVFGVAVALHSRARKARARAALGRDFWQAALDRLDDRWQGTGRDGLEHVPADHPVAHDLDLFGTGSLFELLARGRTPLGDGTLARWLLEPATPETCRRRAAAVAELATHQETRVELALLDPEGPAAVDAPGLEAWAGAPPVTIAPVHRWIAWLLAAGSIYGVVAWEVLGQGLLPLTAVALACMVQDRLLASRARTIADGALQADAGLPSLAALLAWAESHPAEAPLLVDLRAALETPEGPPSVAIDRLARLAGGLKDATYNPFFAPLAYLLRYRVHRWMRLEAWRQRVGPVLPGWIEAAGAFEALATLGTYAAEHPEQVAAEVLDEGPCLEARGLGHPLLAAERCVRNDLSLGRSPQLLLVSGSNMSGKSTWLRTIGTSVVLVRLGAPVRAESMRLHPPALGVSIQIQDSLLDGASHFYAEIRRLATIVETAERHDDTLVLLDEILHGTNSAERLAGARAVILRLLELGATGLVTTHDLALTSVVDELGERARNVHFADGLAEGRMAFDYTLRDGVVSKGNALALMRELGLPV